MPLAAGPMTRLDDRCQPPRRGPAATGEGRRPPPRSSASGRVTAAPGPAVPQHRVRVRFYQELGDFLAPHLRGREFELTASRGTTTKALVEHCGVPHGEVDLLLVEGESVDFSYQVQHGQRVSVYPVFESFDISALTRVRPAPLRVVRFLVDANLAKLATLLRMCGLDATDAGMLPPGAADREDARLMAAARREQRIILTRDRRLLARRAVTHGCFVRSQDPEQQLRFVLRRFHLAAAVRPFSRCMRCNTPLQAVAKADVLHLLPPMVRVEQQSFSRCPRCRRLYWPGSHWQRMRRRLDALLATLATPAVRTSTEDGDGG